MFITTHKSFSPQLFVIVPQSPNFKDFNMEAATKSKKKRQKLPGCLQEYYVVVVVIQPHFKKICHMHFGGFSKIYIFLAEK